MNRDAEHWEQRYVNHETPWDSGAVSPFLQQTFTTFEAPPTDVLEIGCGTGINAIWLASRGCNVIATDISKTAIGAACARREEVVKDGNLEGPLDEPALKKIRAITFRVEDLLDVGPAGDASIDFAFDRGAYHALEEHRPRAAKLIAALLRPGGFWLNLSGNADEAVTPGPPRISATTLMGEVEPHFEVISLKRITFRGRPRNFLFWAALLKKRAIAL